MNRKKRFNKRSIVAILFFLSAFIMSAGRAMADNNPLCFTAKGGSVTVRFQIKNVTHAIEYSNDNSSWSTYTSNTDTVLSANGKVYFRAVTNHSTETAFGANDDENSSHFYFTSDNDGTVEASGNIMSLYGPDCPNTELPAHAFAYMFENCTLLTAAPELPATTLASNCYEDMFYGCAALATAPALPATVLAGSCYSHMFDGCTSLTTPPDLPATDLKDYCYSYMFRCCSSMTTLPDLPATEVNSYCYSYMFNGCTSLVVNPNNGQWGKEWSIDANSASATYWNEGMFAGTSGNTGDPATYSVYRIESATAIYTTADGNWSSAFTTLPTANDYVIINHNCTIPDGSAVKCNNITIGSTGKLVLSPDASLELRYGLDNNDTSKLVLMADRDHSATLHFICDEPKAIVQMCMRGTKTVSGDTIYPEWQYRGFVGTPDASQNLKDIVIYEWNEANNSTNTWTSKYNGYETKSATGTFEGWKGYAMANFDEQYAIKSYGTKLKPISNDEIYNLTRTTDGTGTQSDNCGVNLRTNSFSAPIDMDNTSIQFVDAQSTFYLFNTRSHSSYISNPAAAITTYPSQIGSYIHGTNRYIPAGQSFAVKATSARATLTIPASAVSTFSSGAMYAPANKALPLIKITIDGDELYLVQVDNCSADFDNGYDGTKLFSTKAHQIYATNDYGKTAVNSDRTLLGQYIGFKPLSNGTTDIQMTISSRDLEGYEKLYLYDHLTDTYTEITDDEVTYTFTSTGEENERRFQIVGKASDGTEYLPKAQPRIEVAGGEIWLMNFERTDAPVIVTDATGKTLWSVNAKEGTKFTLPELPKGVYIVSCGKVSTKYVQ